MIETAAAAAVGRYLLDIIPCGLSEGCCAKALTVKSTGRCAAVVMRGHIDVKSTDLVDPTLL